MKKPRKTRGLSIFVRIFVAFLLVNIATSAVLIILTYSFSRDYVEEEAKQNVSYRIAGIQAIFETSLRTVLDNTLRALVRSSALDEYLSASELERTLVARKLERLLAHALRDHSSYKRVAFINASGELTIEGGAPLMRDDLPNLRTGNLDTADRRAAARLFHRVESTPLLLSSGNMEWFMPPREMEVEGPFIDDEGRVSILAGIGKLDLDTGQFGGVVMVKQRLDEILGALREVTFFDTNPVWVFGRSMEVIQKPVDDAQGFDPRPHMVVNDFQGSLLLLEVEEGIVAYQDLAVTAGQPFLRIAVAIPNELLFEQISPVIRFFTAVLIGSIVVVLIVAMYVSRYLSRPIVELASAALRLSSGDLSTRVEIRATGEVEVLVNSFNDMTLELRETMAARDQSVASLVKEVGERKSAEAQLKVQAEELTSARVSAEGAAKAKSQFLANMSHEIRTPMNGVLGMADLLAETNLNEVQNRYLSVIRNSGKTLLTIINDILDLSKIEAGKLNLESVPFDLRGVVNEVIELFLETASSKSVLVTASVSDALPQAFRGDPNRLRQVLSNLVSNAIKFTGARGRVEIVTVGEVLDEATYSIRFEVKDNGIGIEQDKLGRLFEAFEQADGSTSRRYGGTGLGLTIVSEFAQMMGGDVSAYSVVGQGSTFVFEVPLARAPDAELEQAAADAAAGAAAEIAFDARVLLAEDNAVNQMVAKEALGRLGCDVTVATNGAEAFEAWKGGGFDMILMDCQMPELDGFGATALIRDHEREANVRRRIPIVALTAHVLDEDHRRCREAGMDDYLSKPFDKTSLIAVLMRWLESSQVHRDADEEPTTKTETPEGSEQTVLDQSVIDNLKAMGGSSEIVRRLAAIYASTAPDLFNTLCQAAHSGDAEAVSRSAHTLKSSSANLGARRFSSKCQQIEQWGAAGDLEKVRSEIMQLEREFESVQRAVQRMRAA